MLSGKLIRLIEVHQEQITSNFIREIRAHPDMAGLRKLSDVELRERSQQILEYLGHWLSAGHEAEIEQRYETLGKTRFEESIPLHELVHALAIIKDKMIDFVHDQGLDRSPVDLYAEEEVERRVGRFLDALTVSMVRGYENAWHRAAHLVA